MRVGGGTSKKGRPGGVLKVIALGHSPCSWNVVATRKWLQGQCRIAAATGGNTMLLLGPEEREKDIKANNQPQREGPEDRKRIKLKSDRLLK